MTDRQEVKNTEAIGVRFSEAAIIAIAPAVAYFLAYISELGYCMAIGIPSEFIQIELKTVLGFTLALVIVILIMTIVIDVAFSFFVPHKDSPTAIYKVIVARSPILIIAVIFLIVYGFDTTGWKIIGYTALLIFSTDIFPALIPRKHLRGLTFSERIDNVLQSHRKERDAMVTIYDKISNRLGRNSFFIMFYAFWAIMACFYMGRVDASRKTTFLSPTHRPELLVGKIYGNNIICFSVDNITKNINPGIVIFNTAQYKDIELTDKMIGRINIRK